ncbi:hypothetical protein [Bythopirellula polymerisocia]|nr:hypothetical protein [Bythopirellula polymerisocia]
MLFLTVLACLLVVGCFQSKSNQSSTSDQQSRSIYALGRIEPASGIISVSAVPGERLMLLDPDVTVNQQVPANGILGLLSSFDLGKAQLNALIKKKDLAEKNRTHQIAVAVAQKAQAEASLAQAKAKLRELELQEDKLRSLETASMLANENLIRLETLHADDPDLVTDYQLRKQRNEMDTALADYHIANDSYDTTKEAAEKAVTAAEANISVANLSLKQLDQKYEEQAINQEIEVAKETLKRSVLLSPHVSPDSLKDVLSVESKADHKTGSTEDRGPYTVLKTYLQPGEFITQTPIMQLGDLRQMVCIAEVYEADVKNLKINQPATIHSPSLSGEYADRIDPQTNERTGGIPGHIVQIGGVIGSPGLASRNPLAPADRSVVDVRIAIDDPDANHALSRLVGLEPTVEFGRLDSASVTASDRTSSSKSNERPHSRENN